MPPTTYKDAGVDLELYEQAMGKLPPLLQRTRTPRVMEMTGGFAGLFRLNGDGHNYTDPVLVSGSDGVGTKIKVAAKAGIFNTVGIDLVAMCVNDCLCLGAEPLFFLDYIALGQDDPELLASLVEGVSHGCVESKMALLGGETAVMPALYAEGEFDMAGFCVGVVERTNVLDGHAIQAGDVVLGLDSSGFHSNGYSLIRKVVFEKAKLDLDDIIPELSKTVGEVLLAPTKIYAAAIRDILTAFNDGLVVSGIAHITGGGIAENLERILPENRRVSIDCSKWDVPAQFGWLEELGQISRDEMFRVFNMGIGMAVIVRKSGVDDVRNRLIRHNIEARVIGKVTKGERGVELS